MAKTSSISPPIHHRVAIHGRVAIGFKLEGEEKWTLLPQLSRQVQVEIIAAPASFQRQLSLKSLSYGQNWDALSDRPDRTHTAADGSFYFIDLPLGQYTLKATCPRQSTRLQGAEAVVEISDGQKPEWKELILATTGIVGQVKTKLSNSDEFVPVRQTQIQVVNGSEQTRCDRDGKFQLLNLEAPENPSIRKLRLQISAPGYDTYTQDVDLLRGAVHSFPNIQLTKKVPVKANGTSA
ncbi:MAG TPA: hypothetical protein V6D16_00635 [Candidatus Obscuribacterales bacterium]